jgi:hypothetical protein
MLDMSEWVAWHERYTPGSPLARRLDIVQGLIRSALDASPPGPIHLISMCAGDGRDIFGVLPDHPRQADVHARLVELDPELARRAREHRRRIAHRQLPGRRAGRHRARVRHLRQHHR